MYTKVSVLVPTRKRPERLLTLLMSYAQTVTNPDNAELVFRVDDDDTDTIESLNGWNVHVGPRLDGYASMPTFFNEAAAAATGDVLMCGNDDMVFKTVGWADQILQAANAYPDGLFDIGVKTHNHTHYPFSTVSKRAVDALGFIWDPRIFWGDMYLRDAMAAFGRCVPLHQVQIDHDWAGWNPDAVYEEGLKPKRRGERADYWATVHAPAVADAVERLKVLQCS
jgi:hypothetical protein